MSRFSESFGDSGWLSPAGSNAGLTAEQEAALAIKNAAYDARQAAVAASVSAVVQAKADKAVSMTETVKTLNYVIGLLVSEGLYPLNGQFLEIKNLRSKGGDFIVANHMTPEGKRLAAEAIAIYRDSEDTQVMGDRIADIYGLLSD